MKNIILILKGFFIGIGKIIPGVSGSLIAVSLGVYDKMIESVQSFFKDIKGNSLFLMKIGTGILIALMIFSKLIGYLTDEESMVCNLIRNKINNTILELNEEYKFAVEIVKIKVDNELQKYDMLRLKKVDKS